MPFLTIYRDGLVSTFLVPMVPDISPAFFLPLSIAVRSPTCIRLRIVIRIFVVIEIKCYSIRSGLGMRFKIGRITVEIHGSIVDGQR